MIQSIAPPISRRQAESSHADRSALVTDEAAAQDNGAVEMALSWRRCIADHHLDASVASAPNILTERELAGRREAFNAIVLLAHEEIDHLYAIVRQLRYVVLLCNTEGIALHHRGNEAMADQFKYWGVWLGGVWSEHLEGTNGIGTCIVEQRPISVHRDQHFRSRHVGLSCAGAPVFDARARLVAVLDCSSIAPEISDHAHALTLAATITAAREIEERLFRDAFHQSWLVAAISCDDSTPALLVALDDDRHIIGADRIARSVLNLSDEDIARGVHLRTVFDGDVPLRRDPEDDVAVCLTRGRDASMWHALVTAPDSAVRRRGASLHTRPRIALLDDLPQPTSATRSLGGLPPAVRRRLREHIDAHLDENIGLDRLAAAAGLSVHYFARAFRQSFGEPPHSYVLRRRIERAQEMLKRTDQPLSEIALAVGFSDHSHFARYFRRLVGVTPSAARWRER
jgi:transcriptional regulator of acetoin/glycerol metabolism/AraC-like DNA-binding protein